MDLLNYLDDAKIISIHDKIIQNFSNLPEKLPNLSEIDWSIGFTAKDSIMRDFALSSLNGLPPELPALQGMYFQRNRLKLLEGFPEFVPNLKELDLSYNGLINFKGISAAIPNLTHLNGSFNQIHDLHYFPVVLPSIELLNLQHNQLHTINGLPIKMPQLHTLLLDHNHLNSFAGLPYELPNLKQISIRHNPLKSLHGISLNLLPVFLEEIQKNLKKFQFSVIGSNIIKNAIDNLENNAILIQLFEYYQRSPLEIAKEYVKNEFSIPKNDLDRLCHESSYLERNFLEFYLPDDDPILRIISEKLILHGNYSTLL